eukprot:Partr_v1_DN26236_c0_g1_i2_m48007 putative coiledcoil domain containing
MLERLLLMFPHYCDCHVSLLVHLFFDKILGLTEIDHNVTGENLYAFAAGKKEILLMQYSLHIKNSEIERMSREATEAEESLTREERELEEEAAAFDKLLTQNDKLTMDIFKKTEVETKIRLEKTQELKKQSHVLVTINTNLIKNEDELAELQKYRDFVLQLLKMHEKDQSTIDDDAIFEEPEQLLAIFSKLEESTLTMIQSCQEAEVSLEDLKRQLVTVQKDAQSQISQFQAQIAATTSIINEEQMKAEKLREKISQFSNGQQPFEESATSQSKADPLTNIIRSTYRKCIGDTDNTISTMTMLTAIENKLEKVLETIASLPLDKVEAAEKILEKERRQKMRLEKQREAQALQEERARKALERALQESKSIQRKPIDRKELYKPRLLKKAKKVVESEAENRE